MTKIKQLLKCFEISIKNQKCEKENKIISTKQMMLKTKNWVLEICC